MRARLKNYCFASSGHQALSKGFFITLEGGEGAGKSTQARLMNEYLLSLGREVLLTREPGGTIEAEKIRNLIVDRDGGNWSALEETLLFFTARHHHVVHKIKPALNMGQMVICDRFTDSTIAYQGYGRAVDMTVINFMQDHVMNGFEPDLTFLFDLPVEEGLARSSRRQKYSGSTEDRFENMDVEFHERMRNGFLTLAEQNKHRFVILDATQPINEIQNQIQLHLKQIGF